MKIRKISIIVILIIAAIFATAFIYGFAKSKNKPANGIMIKRIDIYAI